MIPRAYSDDLRWKIVWQHYFFDVAAEKVAEIMQVSVRSVYRYTKLEICPLKVHQRLEMEKREKLQANAAVILLWPFLLQL